ncbi:hypothetical protein [Maribacter halichondriae]|uniref:hypothetical protein n=1 Tax=Maribacter halichondriae TaxID=2980554 RepID=UPI002359276F|nr:hypothetical protein [Maribacter sp. Hal144]
MRPFVLVFFLITVCFDLNAQTDTCACCSEDHTAFDFWIGEWEVTNPDGTLGGKNNIDKIQDGCILRENWTGASGNTGTSTNFYNLKTKQWEQLWVDNSGTHIKLKGNRIGNQMILSSDEFTHTDGKIYTNRITWTLNDDGSVRQLWELLQKEKVVNIAFDGLYRKIE